MVRSTMITTLATFGAAALLTLGAGCQKEKPAEQAKQPSPTPAFEAQVPAGSQGSQAQPSQPGTVSGQVAPMNEHSMCSSFAQHSKMRVEDIEGGVAIIAVPKEGEELATLRGFALSIAYTMSPPTGQPPHVRPTSTSERCELFDLSGLATRSGVVEQGNEIRILLLARDTSDVAALRNQARDFVKRWTQEQEGKGQEE